MTPQDENEGNKTQQLPRDAAVMLSERVTTAAGALMSCDSRCYVGEFPGKKAVALIGLPGCGKSFFGKRVAADRGLLHLDTDDLLAAFAGRSVADLAEMLTKEQFIAVEGKIVESIRPFRGVISTGGSVVYSAAAMRHLKSFCHVIFLHASFDKIVQRNRGLRRGVIGGPIEGTFAERVRLCFQYADVSIGV